MLGAAVTLHELMRRGDGIGMAAMSVMTANAWTISVIEVDPLGELSPWAWPFHTLMSLERRCHGSERLGTELANCPTTGPSIRVGNVEARPAVPAINAVATRSEDTVYVHLINGTPADSVRLVIDASASDARLEGPVERHQIYYPDALWLELTFEAEALTVTEIEAESGAVTLDLPPHSVTVLAWPRSEVLDR
jgi:hypothetical protein